MYIYHCVIVMCQIMKVKIMIDTNNNNQVGQLLMTHDSCVMSE